MWRMKLYVDDERTEPPGWVRVSNANNAIIILGTGMVEELSLDYDLDMFLAPWCVDTSHPTGYDVARWLVERAEEGSWDLVPPVLRCHSANPAGRRLIEQAFDRIERMRRCG